VVVVVTHALAQHTPLTHWLPFGQHVGLGLVPQACAAAQPAPLTHLDPSGQHVTAPEAVFLHICPFGQHRPRTHVWPSGQHRKVVRPLAVTLVTHPWAQHLPSRQASFSWQQVAAPSSSQMLRFWQQAPLTQTLLLGQPPQRPQTQVFPCGQHAPLQHMVPAGQQVTAPLDEAQSTPGRIGEADVRQRLQVARHFS